MSYDEYLNLTYKESIDELNESYEIIATMCLSIAAILLENRIRVGLLVVAS